MPSPQVSAMNSPFTMVRIEIVDRQRFQPNFFSEGDHRFVDRQRPSPCRKPALKLHQVSIAAEMRFFFE